MFTKLTRSGGHTYVQLVESFRDETGRPRQRTVSTLGRLDETGGQVDSLLKGLLRAKGMPASMAEPPQVAFESALALGDVWALDQLWKELGFDALAGVFRRARYTTPVEHAIRVMVFNRLCDADSKLGVLRWLQTVSIPQVDVEALTHQHLLRSLDALIDHQQAVDDLVAQQISPLVDQDMSLVFPPRQNSCRPDMMMTMGATRKRDGSLRGSIQEPGCGTVIAAGKRGCWYGGQGGRCVAADTGTLA